jgi:hypothetical protein
MGRQSFVPHILVLVCLLMSTDTSQLMAANMRSFIEAVRRKATVAYVGSVKEVHLLTRTKFDIKARAVVDVLAVARGSGVNPREATVEYSSFDDKTPMLAGGPQSFRRSRSTMMQRSSPYRSMRPSSSRKASPKRCTSRT